MLSDSRIVRSCHGQSKDALLKISWTVAKTNCSTTINNGSIAAIQWVIPDTRGPGQ